MREHTTDRVTEDRRASLRLILVPSWRCVARRVPPRAPRAAHASPRPQGKLRGPQTDQKRAKTREREIDLPKKSADAARALRGLPPAHTPNAATTGAAHTSSTGPPKTPCSRSTSGAPPTPGNLLRQMPQDAIGPRRRVVRMPSVDCLMCSFARPVLHTSDTSSRHAFTASAVSLPVSAAAAVLGTRPAV
eukprot:COSAG06_NODE_629_length_13646_cov_13.351222_9_plen_190_part_00